jgi:hypothetical protein
MKKRIKGGKSMKTKSELIIENKELRRLNKISFVCVLILFFTTIFNVYISLKEDKEEIQFNLDSICRSSGYSTATDYYFYEETDSILKPFYIECDNEIRIHLSYKNGMTTLIYLEDLK